MAVREFLTHYEACELVGDAEAVRQAMLFGRLPTFVELHNLEYKRRKAPGKEFLPGGNSAYASWEDCTFSNEDEQNGFREFLLNGWFGLNENAIRAIASREGHVGFASVSAKDNAGTVVSFHIDVSADLADVWHLAADIERIACADKPMNDGKPQKLRADREQNLLRVIAGLWALSGLPTEHNTTADKISALFTTWQWDKPAVSTVADTILKQAANLPGARIRK